MRTCASSAPLVVLIDDDADAAITPRRGERRSTISASVEVVGRGVQRGPGASGVGSGRGPAACSRRAAAPGARSRARSSPARWSRRRWASRPSASRSRSRATVDLRGTLGVDERSGRRRGDAAQLRRRRRRAPAERSRRWSRSRALLHACDAAPPPVEPPTRRPRAQRRDWLDGYERAWRSPGPTSRRSPRTRATASGPYEERSESGCPRSAELWEAERAGPDEALHDGERRSSPSTATSPVVRVDVAYDRPPQREYRDLWLIAASPRDGRCRAVRGVAVLARARGALGPRLRRGRSASAGSAACSSLREADRVDDREADQRPGDRDQHGDDVGVPDACARTRSGRSRR